MRIIGFAVFVIGTAMVLGSLILGKWHAIQFECECSGYLKRAANATSIELAADELEKAIAFLDRNGLDHGSTHAFYSTPGCDLEFWYRNLNTAAIDLRNFPVDEDRMTVSNQLIQLRESLVDRKEKGEKVTLPPNIHLYPHQTLYRSTVVGSLLAWMSSLFLIGGCGEMR